MIKNKFNIGQQVVAVTPNGVVTELIVRAIFPGQKRGTLDYDLSNALGDDLKPNTAYYNDRLDPSLVVRSSFPESKIFVDEADFRKNVIVEKLLEK